MRVYFTAMYAPSPRPSPEGRGSLLNGIRKNLVDGVLVTSGALPGILVTRYLVLHRLCEFFSRHDAAVPALLAGDDLEDDPIFRAGFVDYLVDRPVTPYFPLV